MTFASGTSFYWFGWHPLLESLGIALFSYGKYTAYTRRPSFSSCLAGILTLQPTSQARTKAAGLTRHQLAMIGLGFPIAFLGYLAIFVTKIMNSRAHFTSWHGVSLAAQIYHLRADE
jgi:cytochrome b-561 domain containing protein 2